MVWAILSIVVSVIYLAMGIVLLIAGKDYRTSEILFPKVFRVGKFFVVCGGVLLFFAFIELIGVKLQ